MYWISSISLLRYTTLPGDSARLRPGAKAVASTIVSLPGLDVVQQVPRAVDEAGAASFDRPPQGARVGDQRQGRARRIDELTQMELEPPTFRLVMSISPADAAEQPVRGQQVDVLQRAIGRIVLPLRRGKALVRDSRPGRRVAARSPAPPARACLVPDFQRPPPHPHVELAAAETAVSGRPIECSQTTLSARAISAQSTGMTSRRGLALSAVSTARRGRSFDSISLKLPGAAFQQATGHLIRRRLAGDGSRLNRG